MTAEAARATAVRAAEASSQETAVAWESVMALVKEVKDQAALPERESWERVSRMEVEGAAVLAYALREAEVLT
jgi:hypothetical protein